MAPPRTTAPKTKAAAAQAEVQEEAQPKSAEFRGLALDLPDVLPPTIIFDLTELEAAGENPMPVFRLMRSLLGPEQFAEVRNTIAEDDNLVEVVNELLDVIFAQYGISLGE